MSGTFANPAQFRPGEGVGPWPLELTDPGMIRSSPLALRPKKRSAGDLFLRIPMAWMADVQDFTAFEGLPQEGVQAFLTQYDADERQSILSALRRALADPWYDFEALMLPMQGRSAPANAVIHDFLTKVQRSLQSGESDKTA